MTRIEGLMAAKVPMTAEQQAIWNASFNTMQHEADQCPYQVAFTGPWGFDPVIGAHTMQEARSTAHGFAKSHPESEAYEIGKVDPNGVWWRMEQCDLLPPSDDDRVLQGLGWPTASEREG